MDKKDNLLSISEMAKLRKVTTETLRHYDRIGLFKPAYTDPSSGYRYYTISQYEKLGTIKELRQLGMGLTEIKEYFNNRNVRKSMELLKKYHEQLVKEIQEKKAVEKVIAEKIAFMNSIKDMPPAGRIFESDLPERYMVTYGRMEQEKEDISYALTRLEASMDEVAPVLASNRLGVYSGMQLCRITEELKPGERFEAAPFILCDRKYRKSEYFRRIPAGHYVCAYYNGFWATCSEFFKKIEDYMKKNHLKQEGFFYQIYQIDITLTDHFDETLVELQIPVMKC